MNPIAIAIIVCGAAYVCDFPGSAKEFWNATKAWFKSKKKYF